MSARRLGLALALLLVPGAAAAQVGYPPTASPFRDLVYKQEVTPYVGWFAPQRDPAGVAPRGGPMVGARYAVQFSNPVVLSVNLATLQSDRTVIDPVLTPETRAVGTRTSYLTMADVSLGLALTGFRSWHGIVPEVSAGGGVVTDFRNTDVGGYRFGTPFAFSFAGGVRYQPGGRIQMRLDVTDRLYRIAYPQTFYASTDGASPVLGARESNSLWTHNPSLTIGVSYLFDR